MSTHSKIQSLITWAAICVGMINVISISADQPRDARSVTQSEQLRWKLKAGQKFKVEYDQEMKQTMELGGGEQEMPMHYTMFMSWNVDSVNGEEITVTQTVDRVKMAMSLPGGMGDVDFDSDSDDEPEGFAGQIASGMKPLVGMKIVQTMDGRGKSIKCEIDAAALEELKNSQMTSQFANEDMFKNMVAQAACVLPESAIDPGTTWDDSFEIKNQMGTMKTTAKYKYEGNESIDGKSLEKISVVSNVAIEPNEDSQVEIELGEQDNNGIIYFDNQEGRVTSATMTQSMTMNVSAMGQEIKVVTAGKVIFTIKPDDGSSEKQPETEKADEKSEAAAGGKK